MLLVSTSVFWTCNHTRAGFVCIATLDHVEGHVCVREDSVHRISRAPLEAWPMHLYVCVCVRVRVRKAYGPVTTWSDCSVIFTEHSHVHGRMETAQYNTEGAIIFITYI